MVRRLILNFLLAVGLTGTALFSYTSAGTARPVGHFAFEDLGQGCWGGGAMLADGSLTGSGGCAFQNGQTIIKITPVSWQDDGSGGILFTFTFTVTKPAGGGSFPQTLDVPVTGGPVKVQLNGPGNGYTLVNVSFIH